MRRKNNPLSTGLRIGIGALLALSLSAAPALAQDPIEFEPPRALASLHGNSVDVYGDRAIVGAPGAPGAAGVAYLMERVDGDWQIEDKIVRAQPYLDADFGESVAIGPDWMAIGAPGDGDGGSDSGAVYVWRLTPTGFLFAAKLTSQFAQAAGRYGSAVALDGDTLVIGEPGSDRITTDGGAVEIFQHNGGDWIRKQRIEASAFGEDRELGAALDIDGDIAIGSPTGNDGGLGTGRVQVFRYSLCTEAWLRADVLKSDFADELGRSVDILGDHLIAGAPSSGISGTGAVVFYDRLSGVNFEERTILYGQQTDERLGASVSLGFGPGNILRAAVGAPDNNGFGLSFGAVQVFQRLGSNWLSITRLTPDAQSNFARVGRSVLVDGAEILAGAPQARLDGLSTGLVHRFDISPGVWTERASLEPREIDPLDRFGRSIAIAGDLAIVGAPGDDDRLSNAGAAFLFVRDGDGWRYETKLTAGAHIVRNGAFGDSVDTDGECVIVGAPLGPDNGAAYVFENVTGFWELTARLVPNDVQPGSRFAQSVAIESGVALVGAYQAQGPGGVLTGAAYLYDQSGSGDWFEADKLIPFSGATSEADFGFSVEITERGPGVYELFAGVTGDEYVANYSFVGGICGANSPILPGPGFSPTAFGSAVSAAGDRLAVSAPKPGAGSAVHLYTLTPSGWQFQEGIEHDSNLFGLDLAYDGERVAVGSPAEATMFEPFGQLFREQALGDYVGGLGSGTISVELNGGHVAFGDFTSGLGGKAWVTPIVDQGPFLPYGFGDGSGRPCPCGNESAPGSNEGCANSTGGGALLLGEGTASIAADDLVVAAGGLPPGRPTQLFVGVNRLLGAPFGDGQRLVGGDVERLALRVAAGNGTARWSLSHGLGYWMPRDTRYFQAFYRDAFSAGCGNGFNTTAGLAIRFED